MAAIYNEFDIPDLNPLDNVELFIGIGNTQHYLDEHFKDATKPIWSRIGRVVVEGLVASGRLYGLVPPILK